MESRSKKARSHRAAPSSSVPHDVLRFNILPRLSFKSLARFKSVSKSWHALISGDPLFAADQSLHPSPASSGFVYLGSSGLGFLSAPDTPIGVPDPSYIHAFLSFTFYSYRLKLVASTNGLVCCGVGVPDFNRGVFPSFNLLYVFNPVTEEAHLIPATKLDRLFVGLAFDPSDSPRRYTLVCLRRRHAVIEGYLRTQFRFHVFSSDTRQWVVSSQRVVVDDLMLCEPTAVFAGGVLYWDCRHYLIWFDPYKNLAGWTPLPERQTSARQHRIGVWEGRVLTCTQTWIDEVEVFVMANGSSGNWVRRHRASFKTMVRRNPEVFARFCHPMRLRSESFCKRVLSRWFLRPLALDGGDKLYVGVRSRVWKSKRKERVICYDLRTGEITSISDGVRFMSPEERVFCYHNSMVRMPRPSRQR